MNWTNAGPSSHDVAFEAGQSSGLPGSLAAGASWEYTFTTAGVFKYHCGAHSPGGYDPPNVMIGRVTVLVPAVSPPAEFAIDIVSIVEGFSPKFLEVATGDTVTFTNRDSFGHDVAFEAGFSSGPTGGLAAGATWSHTFDTAGTFRFRCVAHTTTFDPPNTMIGTVVVFDRALRPALNVTTPPPSRAAPGAALSFAGTAADNTGVTGVSFSIDGGAPQAADVTEVTAGDPRAVTWTANLPGLAVGTHTLTVVSTNGAHNSTVYSISILVASAAGPPSGPAANPFGDTFLFEDILTKYFWLIMGVTVILLAVVMMFLSYSGKLQNYYIVLLTALDERHRFFAFARPTREFLYTIQRQMPRTHTERYNLKVIWYWYPLYCLGGLSFAAFIIETITGIILGFYYIPEGTGPNEGLPSAAYRSMETIMTQVTFGYIFRALHHWGAHMMVAAVFLHMMRVYFVGAYKNPRELNWLLGVILLNVTLLFGYTGYLLPWDQLSFWAGQIGLEMANTIPVIGEIIGNMLFGGPELSGATIIRMYYLHVFVLPLIGGALMVLHMGIVWMQGVAEPH